MGIGIVKSILVEKTINYRHLQRSLVCNTMVLIHRKVIDILATSLAWFLFISYVYIIYPPLKWKLL